MSDRSAAQARPSTEGSRPPVVSIVTISFNQGEFLERTIRSVLEQDYPHIEYIVVDPGSKDGSRGLLDRYRPSIAKLILEPDNGPADGLNRGFSVATGEIFAYLNADDVLRPNAVSEAVKYLSERPEIDVVSGHAELIDPKDRLLRRTYSDRMSIPRSLYAGVVLIQPSTFFRRRAFSVTNGFNPANRVSWDSELFFDMARAGCRFGLCSRIWSGYRLHHQSITLSQRHKGAAREVLEKRFQQVLGRRRSRLDGLVELGWRTWKHLTNPRDTIERIRRGPISGRTLSD